MNKNVKRIVAMAVAMGTLSAVAPATSINLLTTKAYASTDDLGTVELVDEDGAELDLYEDDDYVDEYTDDLDEGETYYAESTTDEVSIDNISEADEDYVRIFLDSDDDYDDAYEVGDSIDIEDGSNTLSIRVYEDDFEDMDEEDYEDADYDEYEIEVEYDEDEDDDSDDDDDDDDDENDEDELDSLELLDEDGDNIDLYDSNDYEDEVDSEDVDEGETYYAEVDTDVSVEIDGPDEDYVKIFKSTSDSAKGVDPGEDISVASDKTLTVRIYSEEPDSDITFEEDDDVIGEYEIELEYTDDEDSTGTGTGSATTKPSTGTEVITTAPKSQWVKVNGLWKYNDASGKAVMNTWVQNYYLKADGNMATEWATVNGSWYYFGADGAKKLGWQKAGGTWYYLDGEGKMKTGWVKDTDGKYYYLNTNGSMAYNTTVGGYKLGASGAWIK